MYTHIQISILFAIESWSKSSTYIHTYIHTYIYTHIQISVLFAIEVLVKITAAGVRTYCKNPWRVLELFVAACCIADAANDNLPLETFKSIRTLRLLRVVGMVGEFDQVSIDSVVW
jgi:hypothetical protein